MSTRTRLNLLAASIIVAGSLVRPATADSGVRICDITAIAPAIQEEATACMADGGRYSFQAECHANGSVSWIGTCTPL